MWELSSSKPPFIDYISEDLLRSDLIKGCREEPVSDTPDEYLKLYNSCWVSEPNARPSINQVFNKLGKILYARPKKIHETSELVNLIKDNRLTEIIDKKDLSEEKSNVDGDTILKATRKKTKCLVVLKTIKLNEAFIHELKMHKTLNSYLRIVPILGISLGELI
jgi:hypothetical protein